MPSHKGAKGRIGILAALRLALKISEGEEIELAKQNKIVQKTGEIKAKPQRAVSKEKPRNQKDLRGLGKWSGAGSNRRHMDFQSMIQVAFHTQITARNQLAKLKRGRKRGILAKVLRKLPIN